MADHPEATMFFCKVEFFGLTLYVRFLRTELPAGGHVTKLINYPQYGGLNLKQNLTDIGFPAGLNDHPMGKVCQKNVQIYGKLV